MKSIQPEASQSQAPNESANALGRAVDQRASNGRTLTSRVKYWHAGRIALLGVVALGLLGLAVWVLHQGRNPLPVPHGRLGWVAAISIPLILGMLATLIWLWLVPGAGERVEDPTRIYQFRTATEALPWGSAHREGSLRALGSAVAGLALAEVRYYYVRRRRSRIWSGFLRFAAWGLGTAGILIPLASAAMTPGSPASPWGYVLLAASASILAANTVFDGTHAHVRSTQSQLSLEQLLTEFLLMWNRILAEHGDFTAEPVDGEPGLHPGLAVAFVELLAFARAVAQVVNDETGAWATGVAASIEEIRATAGSHRSTGKASAPTP